MIFIGFPESDIIQMPGVDL